MSDFLKEASKLQQQYSDIGKQIIQLYNDNWEKLVGRYFYHPYEKTYIKITGVSKMLFGDKVLRYTYCKKKHDTYDNGDYEYTTQSGYFTKGSIPKDLVEVDEQVFVDHVTKFFNEATHYVMTYVKGEKKNDN